MEYQKVGRGGAGNFYSPKDLENASRQNFKDVEAQRDTASAGVDDLQNQKHRISTSGRGGAGNITTRHMLDAGTTANVDVTSSMQENKPPELGHYGRGGAGNCRTPDSEKIVEREKEKLDAQEKAHQKVVKDVETRLKEPEKAHLGREGLEYVADN